MERSFNLLLENKGGWAMICFLKQKLIWKKCNKKTFTANVWEDNFLFITLLKKY